MAIFASEQDLLDALRRHDDLVHQCARGELAFDSFCELYGSFYSFYALDGHESDEEEQELLDRYDSRIEPHRIIAFDILGHVCSDEDASRELYIQAGRFGSIEAIRRLQQLVAMQLPPAST